MTSVCNPTRVLLSAILIVAVQQIIYVTYYSDREFLRRTFVPWLCQPFPKRFIRKASEDTIVHDSVFSPSQNRCFRAMRADNTSEYVLFCYPSIVIMGFPKCGTSYLFKALSTHPQILATKRKELCIGGIKSETWWDFFTRLPIPEDFGTKRVMSGCLHLGANKEAASSLCISDTKYVFIVRDVADMLWAAYNYWCIRSLNPDCSPGGRTSTITPRSPEDFHALMVSNSSLGGGLSLDARSGVCFREQLGRRWRCSAAPTCSWCGRRTHS